MTTTTSMAPTASADDWYRRDVTSVAEALGSNPSNGLTAVAAAALLERHGPNTLTQEKPGSVLQVVAGQFRDPMTLMFVVVAAVSFVIAQASTAWVVIALIALNVVLGTNQELKEQASVAALAGMQVPQAKVTRGGSMTVVPAASAFAGFTMHRNRGSSFEAPVLRPLALTGTAVLIMLVTTELSFLSNWLLTVPLTGGQWLVCLGLALVFGVVVELDKGWQRRRAARQGGQS